MPRGRGGGDIRGGGVEELHQSRPGPRLFVDRVGSSVAQVSWVPLGGVGEEAASFEVELRRYPEKSGRDLHKEPRLESLGCFVVPGGTSARNQTLRRLRPLQWHRARCRAVGEGRSWVSEWSQEESFKTLSVEAARARGCRMTADGFFAPSERRVCAAVRGGVASSTPAARAAAEVDAPEGGAADGEGGSFGYPGRALLPSVEEIADLRAQVVNERLNEAFGPATESTVKEILDARHCKGGFSDYVRLGARYSRPPDTRDQRMQRMRLVLAAQEIYEPSYGSNPWFMGPLYYEDEAAGDEDLGRRIVEAAAAAVGGA
eukprot:TRINITY_DN23689_c0_g5_i1.p1 TRINITY_DN23689_c0_g5~~TRINITY_DN23689_c0_g5_i1.p1  ORF type:complete len:355 (-),score=76.45 TRINITY_DN23689_c0_g5_i1:428-1378(-)